MRPLSGTGARLAAVCVLLSAAAVSCASPAPGASPPGAGGQTSVTVQQPSPTSTASPVRMTLPPNTYTAMPTTPVPKGCLSGTVAITHRPAETETSVVCIKAGARLRLTITVEGEGGWTALQVTPEGAATVASTTDSTGIVRAIVAPAGATPFCLSTDTTSTTAPAASWRLCVTVRR
jgi:hypothetical protein